MATADQTDTTVPRCGDYVFHRPTEETWMVAWAEGEDLAWAGWPDGKARLSDCDVVYRCTGDEHRKAVDDWRNVTNDTRPHRVLRLYGNQ
jgi:hypothetical protein